MKKRIQSDIEILEAAIDSLYYTIVVDINGKIVRMSKDYLDLQGYNLSDVVGKPIKEVIPDTKCMEVLESGEEQIGYLYTLKNGQMVIANRFVLKKKGEIIGVLTGAPFMNLKAITDLGDKIAELEEKNKLYYDEVVKMKDELIDKYKIVGNSPSLLSVIDEIDKVAATDLTILLTGETGTGKEIFSNYIQYKSERKYQPFVKVNCAAIPKDLLESELFGYEEGAFSGAKKGGKRGKFELANEGTILLDEIGEMSLDMQAKLLRVLQERTIDKVGGIKPVRIDVRVICATNANLKELVKEKKFREDLFYRINGLNIELPPLRKRREDIEDLVEFFINKSNKDYGLSITGISSQVIELFKKHSWQGNVRELEHVMERAVIIKKRGNLDISDFSFFHLDEVKEKEEKDFNSKNLSLEELEAEKIRQTLEKHQYNKTQTSIELEMSRTTLYAKIKKYGIG